EGKPPTRDQRYLWENSASHVFSILVVGYRSGTFATQLGCRPRGTGRFWDVVLWPSRSGRTNDAGHLWGQLSRLHDANRPRVPIDILKLVRMKQSCGSSKNAKANSCLFCNIRSEKAVRSTHLGVYLLRH